MTFGEKVKAERTKNNLSQPDLAKLIGASTRTIAYYEAGKTYPRTLEVYDRLAKALHVDVNYLRTENEEFMTEVGEKYGSRGQAQAQAILEQSRSLFAGGELSPEDEIAFLQEIQQLYLDSKIRAKKYTPKKYLKPEPKAEN